MPETGRKAVSAWEHECGEPPDPGRAGTVGELVDGLRRLKAWAGDPSYVTIVRRINTAWAAAGRPDSELARKPTVADCFKAGRRRLNTDLVIAVVAALHPDPGYVTQWRQALQVTAGQAQAAAQVRVQDRVPPDLAGFIGRTVELERLRQAVHDSAANGAVVVSAIVGMAGVGKSQLAVHAAHQLAGEQLFERVLFVNLRGFHPDPGQPPADPGAVLDGFLRLLGMPGQQIPPGLGARVAAYRARLVGTRTLVILDNAADADQARPLLPDTPGCPAIVTSRRDLTALHPAAHLTVDVLTPAEAARFLAESTPEVPVGGDPHAASRIASRCGHLPLALGLVAAHIRTRTGWTLTDHAGRLDDHHEHGRLEAGVELALDLSYQDLPSDRRRLLRLAALHPGQDIDPYAAAALLDVDLPTAQAHLQHLCQDNLLQSATPGRCTFHDLVRGYATARAGDDDPPAERRAALTRLFDYYLHAAATAMDALYPNESLRRPRIPTPGTPTPDVTGPDAARAWLDAEHLTLVAIVAHTATHGWRLHTIRLSATLFRYFDGGHHTDGLAVFGHALHAARHTGDPAGQAQALTGLGLVETLMGRYQLASEHLRQALDLLLQTGDETGRACVLSCFGFIALAEGRYRSAIDYYEQTLSLYRQLGNPVGVGRTLDNLGIAEERLGRYQEAVDYHEQALALSRRTGDDTSEATALGNLGHAQTLLGRYQEASDHLQQSLHRFRRVGHRSGEAWTLDSLGSLHTRLRQLAQAAAHYQHALAIHRETGDRDGEAWALNGLGEAAHADGRPTDALTNHTDAHRIAVEVGDRNQQARAHTGLAHAYEALGDAARARHHHQHAVTLYTDLGTTQPDQIRTDLTTVEDPRNTTAAAMSLSSSQSPTAV